MKDKNRNTRERLLHIQKAIEDINRFLACADEDKFISDELLYNAVLMQRGNPHYPTIEIMGYV